MRAHNPRALPPRARGQLQRHRSDVSNLQKSLADYSTYWQALDREIEQHEVPEEYRGWTACIACNDCGEETNDLPFNLMALKCGNPSCGSYNTTRLTVLQGNGVELDE